MLRLHISIPVAVVSTTYLCLSIIYIEHEGSKDLLPSYRESRELNVLWSVPPLQAGVGLQVTECVVELSGLSMGGWPAMGLKDNAVPRVALMTLKCWAITGTWTGL